MTQTPAIIEWIKETWLHPPLLPRDAQGRAQVRAMAAIVGCDIHPLNNRRVLEMLRKRFGCDEASVNEWCVHWIAAGFDAIETICRKTAAEFFPSCAAIGALKNSANVFTPGHARSRRKTPRRPLARVQHRVNNL